eukprot:2466315-Rhodomonas_salina.2
MAHVPSATALHSLSGPARTPRSSPTSVAWRAVSLSSFAPSTPTTTSRPFSRTSASPSFCGASRASARRFSGQVRSPAMRSSRVHLHRHPRFPLTSKRAGLSEYWWGPVTRRDFRERLRVCEDMSISDDGS